MPVHKKEDKNLIKNCRRISLLPIFGNIFERKLFKIYLTTFIKIIFWQNTSLHFYLMILACHSCYLLFMISTTSQYSFWLWSNSGLPQTFLNQKSRHGIQIDISFPDCWGEIDINFPDNWPERQYFFQTKYKTIIQEQLFFSL